MEPDGSCPSYWDPQQAVLMLSLPSSHRSLCTVQYLNVEVPAFSMSLAVAWAPSPVLQD